MNNSHLVDELDGTAEAELKVFLKKIGVHFPIAGRSIGQGYFVTELNDLAKMIFRSQNGNPILLSYQIGSEIYPISIFFIEADTQKFGHCTLLLNSYAAGEHILLALREATQTFFARSEDLLLGALNPIWLPLNLKGIVDRRVLWDQELGADFTPENFNPVNFPKLTVLPSVYHFNNPYLKHVSEATLTDLKEGERVLVMGSGVGAEVFFLAQKTRIQIDAVDINPLAVLNTQMTAARAGLSRYVNAWESDLFSEVYEKYDVICFNAPLAVATRPEGDPNRFDFEGRLLKQLLCDVSTHLTSNGRLYVMTNPNLEDYLPAALENKVRRVFTAVIECAIHEVTAKRLGLGLSVTSPENQAPSHRFQEENKGQ